MKLIKLTIFVIVNSWLKINFIEDAVMLQKTSFKAVIVIIIMKFVNLHNAYIYELITLVSINAYLNQNDSFKKVFIYMLKLPACNGHTV